MAYKYDVKSFVIEGDELKIAFDDSRVASIIIHLYEEEGQGGKTGFLIADVYTADSSDKKIRYVKVKWGQWRTVPQANEFIQRDVFITRTMMEEVLEEVVHGHRTRFKIKSMDFSPKKYTHKEKDPPGDYKKDFVAYNVKIKRDQIK